MSLIVVIVVAAAIAIELENCQGASFLGARQRDTSASVIGLSYVA